MNVPSILIDTNGSLPHPASFLTTGTTQVFQVSGSGWTQRQPTLIGMNMLIDGQNVGTCTIWSNVNNSHASFVSKPIITHLRPGSHTLELTALNAATFTDVNDHFNVLVSDLG